MMAFEAVVQRLASVRADSIMARSSESSNARGRRYVCSPPRFAATIDRHGNAPLTAE